MLPHLQFSNFADPISLKTMNTSLDEQLNNLCLQSGTTLGELLDQLDSQMEKVERIGRDLTKKLPKMTPERAVFPFEKRNFELENSFRKVYQGKIGRLYDIIDEKDKEIAQIRLEKDEIEKKLREKKVESREGTISDEMLDQMLDVMRIAKEELLDTQEELYRVSIQKKSADLIHQREKIQWETEKNQLKKENQMLLNELKSVLKSKNDHISGLEKLNEMWISTFKTLDTDVMCKMDDCRICTEELNSKDSSPSKDLKIDAIIKKFFPFN
ncbi:hypothetical protein B9Z55_013141 [Caenorhabditis nigoni]|nr:hypothetical protein B9Z55_013141 [Caenorhabditis nigoni]